MDNGEFTRELYAGLSPRDRLMMRESGKERGREMRETLGAMKETPELALLNFNQLEEDIPRCPPPREMNSRSSDANNTRCLLDDDVEKAAV